MRGLTAARRRSVRTKIVKPRARYTTNGATTRCRSGSSPSLYVSTSPLSRRYSCTSLRSLAVASGVFGGLVGHAVQGLRAAGAVALRVDDDAQVALLARPPGQGHAKRQVLDGVDRLAVAPDEQAEVVALEHAVDRLVVLVDGHLGAEAERLADGLQHLAHPLDGALRPLIGLAHRLLPDRFFLRRGGAGGGPLGLPLG